MTTFPRQEWFRCRDAHIFTSTTLIPQFMRIVNLVVKTGRLFPLCSLPPSRNSPDLSGRNPHYQQITGLFYSSYRSLPFLPRTRHPCFHDAATFVDRVRRTRRFAAVDRLDNPPRLPVSTHVPFHPCVRILILG